MRWAMALGWLLVAGFLQAEAPMDLDSPFPKVVLLRDGKGSVQEREVLWVKQAGESLEMETIKGTRALFPRT